MEVIMYSHTQNAINHYKDISHLDISHSYNTVDPVAWVNAGKMLAVLQDHSIIIDPEKMDCPPMVEADWDTNDTKEFDRLLHKILFH